MCYKSSGLVSSNSINHFAGLMFYWYAVTIRLMSLTYFLTTCFQDIIDLLIKILMRKWLAMKLAEESHLDYLNLAKII